MTVEWVVEHRSELIKDGNNAKTSNNPVSGRDQTSLFQQHRAAGILRAGPFLLAGTAQGNGPLLAGLVLLLYLDQKLIQKNGDFAQVWQLMDFTVAQWADARTAVGSIKNLIEYDCTQARLPTLVC